MTSFTPDSQRKMRVLDFRRVSQFTRHQIRRLEHAHEQFCRLASIRMTSELGAELSLRVEGHDQLPYSVVMDEDAPQNAIVAVVSIDPAGTEIVLLLERPLALSLVTRLLGGEAERPGDDEELTPIEMAIARLVLDKLVETLSGAWSELGEEVYLSLARIEGSPTDVNVAPPSEPTLTLTLQAQIDELTSNMTVCLPYRAVKHVAQRSPDESYQMTAAGGAQIRQHLTGVEVEMRAEVASVQLELADVLKFTAGQTLPLKAQADEGVTLVLDHGPSYTARPALRGSARVVQVMPAGTTRSVASRAAAHAISEMQRGRELGIDLGVLGSLPVNVNVELGRAVVTIGQAVSLAGGEILELDRSPDDPVELYVDGFPYARGELVEEHGEWAVHLTEVGLQRDLLHAQGLSGRLLDVPGAAE